MSDEQQPSTQQILTKEEAAAIQQTKALERLVAAASPMVQQIFEASRAAQREENEHELRITQLEMQAAERLQRRTFPLLWFGLLVITGLLGWSAYAGKWEIVTHALTAIIAGAVGYALRKPAEHHIAGSE